MSRDPAGVHQRAADYFQSFKYFFLLSQPDLFLKCKDRLINGLFPSRCLDFKSKEKIIILKLALSQ